MLPKVIEYKVEGNLLTPILFVDLGYLIDNYDAFMINIKQVRRGRRKGA